MEPAQESTIADCTIADWLDKDPHYLSMANPLFDGYFLLGLHHAEDVNLYWGLDAESFGLEDMSLPRGCAVLTKISQELPLDIYKLLKFATRHYQKVANVTRRYANQEYYWGVASKPTERSDWKAAFLDVLAQVRNMRSQVGHRHQDTHDWVIGIMCENEHLSEDDDHLLEFPK